MKKVIFFPFISICVSVYSYLAVRFYYFSSWFWKDVTFFGGGNRTLEERFFDNVEALSPIVFLVILLIGVCFFGKNHFEKWGWKERCGVLFFAVLGIALDIAFVVLWKKLN